jgi:CxxC motif-containing protein (DUF1111 family)
VSRSAFDSFSVADFITKGVMRETRWRLPSEQPRQPDLPSGGREQVDAADRIRDALLDVVGHHRSLARVDLQARADQHCAHTRPGGTMPAGDVMRARVALPVACALIVSAHLAAQRLGGTPVPGLTVAQQQAFDEGSRTFAKVYTMADGLGPVFNDDSCADCHRAGGGSNRTVRRFGRVDRGVFDPLERLGGSLIQSRGIGSVTTADGTHAFGGELVPPEASVTALRRSTALLGLGFVDAVPDDTWFAIAEEQRLVDPATAGSVHAVFDPATGTAPVGKFGWKAQVTSLRRFSGEALLNEMGITSPGFRDEVCPQGNCLVLAFNPAPALNDDGRDVGAITDFMRMLAAPLRGPATTESSEGERVFHEIGCGFCHRSAIQTGPSQIRALDRAVFQPYSDFLLHDMGSLGDGIAQGLATGRDMRTAPLWGLRTTTRYLHDGSATTLEQAIRRHDGQARGARERFDALDTDRLAWLLAFLRSL